MCEAIFLSRARPKVLTCFFTAIYQNDNKTAPSSRDWLTWNNQLLWIKLFLCCSTTQDSGIKPFLFLHLQDVLLFTEEEEEEIYYIIYTNTEDEDAIRHENAYTHENITLGRVFFLHTKTMPFLLFACIFYSQRGTAHGNKPSLDSRENWVLKIDWRRQGIYHSVLKKIVYILQQRQCG